ncbi:MAG: hypothetical protein HeimC2_10240 [Candidatus Heimdallarchaeota archaeon LC_2]|nr:MAG: hypothetical protein HeimC2_10240 [Candidatus Heimdallarchaeota archaeon LC_2]
MGIRFHRSTENINIIEYQDYLLSDPDIELYDVIISNTNNHEVMTYHDASPILESEFFQNDLEINIEGYNQDKKDLIDTEATRHKYFIKSER